jgi:hypothetical protein
LGTQYNIRDEPSRTKRYIGTSDIGLKRVDSDIVSDSGFTFQRFLLSTSSYMFMSCSSKLSMNMNKNINMNVNVNPYRNITKNMDMNVDMNMNMKANKNLNIDILERKKFDIGYQIV